MSSVAMKIDYNDAAGLAVRKLDPRLMLESPVMLVVEVAAAVCTVLTVLDPSAFGVTVTVWLWLTVLFSTFAEAVAEGRGKAQAATLRDTATNDHGPQGDRGRRRTALHLQPGSP